MKRKVKFSKKRRLNRLYSVLIAAAVICTAVTGITAYIFLNNYNINKSEPTHSGLLPKQTDEGGVSSAVYKAQTEESKPGIVSSDANEQKEIKITPSSLPENFKGFNWEVLKDGTVLTGFERDYSIIFGSPEEYSRLRGVTTFRGNNYRNSPCYGFADVTEEKLESIWFSKTGYIDIWTGVGWTGQPAVVRWDSELKNKMNILPDKKSKQGLIEVIYATLDGKIYFLDIEDGKPTRKPIDVGYVHKGSVTVDPRGYPLLYAGQGIPEKEGEKVPIGLRIFSLIDQKLLHFINGYDKDALRYWGAFDSAPLIHSDTDTLIACGENALLYTIKLNTVFDTSAPSISINPEIVKYRYKSPFGTKTGMENSPAIYRNYIYFADNSGLFQCIDINTMKPVWVRDVKDDTDSTPVIEEVSSSEVYIYTSSELDRQGPEGFSYIRKLNALTGELMWEKAVKCHYDSKTNGGALASPVIGKQDIDNLVIFNIAKTGEGNNESTLLALDKNTGNEVWTTVLKYYSWSSPVDIYTRDGKSYIIIGDSGGFLRLLEGKTGKELHKIPLEANIEASPAVYENMLVVGTRGQKIWGIRIK